MIEDKDIRQWLEDLYSGKGRDVKPVPEDDVEYELFDPRYRRLAIRQYRFRLGKQPASGDVGVNHQNEKTQL